jgi:glucose/arabinose dehydrogenase
VSGSELELVAAGLNFPTSLAFDETGTPFVAESGLPFDSAPVGGVVRRLGSKPAILAQGLRPPVNGLVFANGGFYVSEGGHPGRISRLELTGERSTVVDDLPGPGNYHTNTVAVGSDGWIYFGQGAMTNSAVVGLDSYEIGWLKRLPHAHDLPGYDVVLAGENFETTDPFSAEERTTSTGAFSPFGTPTRARQRVRHSLPCTAAVMRCQPDGTKLELVAWGLRNPYGLGFDSEERLIALDQGADDRGTRPIGNAPDLLYEVHKGAWYGWPDFIGGAPVTDERFQPSRGPQPKFVLTNHKQLPDPEQPLVTFTPHSAATKFDAAPDGSFWVALFGDERPLTAPSGSQEGRKVVRVDLNEGATRDSISAPLQRPIDVRHNSADGRVYILDFGEFEMSSRGVAARAASGKLWRL